jgi:hypothetical protein
MNVHISIHISQKLEATKNPPTGEQTNKLWYTYHGILLSNLKIQTISTGNNIN